MYIQENQGQYNVSSASGKLFDTQRTGGSLQFQESHCL